MKNCLDYYDLVNAVKFQEFSWLQYYRHIYDGGLRKSCYQIEIIVWTYWDCFLLMYMETC